LLVRRGSRASLALGALAAVALIPAFLLFAPSGRWSPDELAVTLALIALFSYFGAVAVQASALLDAGFVAALVAVAFLGPLPAACIWIGTEIAAAVIERVKPTAFLANVASYGWGALAGGIVLAALVDVPVGSGSGARAYAAVALAGLVMLAVNFFVTRTLIAVVRDGDRLRATVTRELFAHSPATLAMIALGVITCFAYAQVGILALGLFAAVVVVPQLVLPALVRPRPVAELPHTEAVALYAQAIGDVMGMGRAERLVLKDAAHFMRERQLAPRRGDLSDFSDGHRLALVEAVLFHREHWDGSGGTPGAVGGEMIPVASRVLAVADAWAGLTALKSPRLTHVQALNQLEQRAGLHFDPHVVIAARVVVHREFADRGERSAYQPSLRRVRVPLALQQLAMRLWGEASPQSARA
jgi:HD domain-containing protein